MNDEQLKETARKIIARFPQQTAMKDILLMVELSRTLRLLRDRCINEACKLARLAGNIALSTQIRAIKKDSDVTNWEESVAEGSAK